MKARELRELGIEGLDARIKEVSAELATLKLRHRSGADVDKPGRIRTLRHDVARMKTVRTELERGIR